MTAGDRGQPGGEVVAGDDAQAQPPLPKATKGRHVLLQNVLRRRGLQDEQWRARRGAEAGGGGEERMSSHASRDQIDQILAAL